MTTKTARREFTDEFQREAAALLRGSGRPLAQAASELGLEPSVLRRWRSQASQAGQAVSAARPGLRRRCWPSRWRPAACRRSLSGRRGGATSWKKAVGIFSTPPR